MKFGLPSGRNRCRSGGGAEVADFERPGTAQLAATWALSQLGEGMHGADVPPEALPPLKHQGIRV